MPSKLTSRLRVALLATAVAVACVGPDPTTTRAIDFGGGAPSGVAAGSSVETITSGGVTRRYRLFVPSSYRQGTPMPLVLSMHGLSLNSAQQERLSGMSAAAEQAGYIVAYPDGTGFIPRWDTAGDKDVQFLRDLIAQLQGRLSIDPARVYATGISNGAQMAYRLGCTSADQIAGLGLVAGGYAGVCQPSRPLPIVAFHGTADTILPYNGKNGRLSIPAWAAGAAAQNGCTNGPATTLQQGSVTGQTWDGCPDNAAVSLYTVAGGGHSWPGTRESFWAMMTTRDIDASPTMLAFFSAHPRP